MHWKYRLYTSPHRGVQPEFPLPERFENPQADILLRMIILDSSHQTVDKKQTQTLSPFSSQVSKNSH